MFCSVNFSFLVFLGCSSKWPEMFEKITNRRDINSVFLILVFYAPVKKKTKGRKIQERNVLVWTRTVGNILCMQQHVDSEPVVLDRLHRQVWHISKYVNYKVTYTNLSNFCFVFMHTDQAFKVSNSVLFTYPPFTHNPKINTQIIRWKSQSILYSWLFYCMYLLVSV